MIEKVLFLDRFCRLRKHWNKLAYLAARFKVLSLLDDIQRNNYFSARMNANFLFQILNRERKAFENQNFIQKLEIYFNQTTTLLRWQKFEL